MSFIIVKQENVILRAGITAMTALVEVNTSYAGDEKLQQVIIKCLDDDDKTIGKKVTLITYP